MALPSPGDPLPGIERGFVEELKWQAYIVGPSGHGLDWTRAFGVELRGDDELFGFILAACQSATVLDVRDRDPYGFTCGAEIELTINQRTRPVRTSWHYYDESSPPRLVSAYPRT
jgi:hypothetical protein